MTELSLLIRNARVFTVNDSQPWAEAVGVEGDRIVFVGSDRDAAAQVESGTKVVDAGGRLVLPGLIDAHVHCLTAHQVHFWADLTPANTRQELIEIMEKHASEHPEHRLVGGTGYRYSAVMVDGKLPDRAALDKVASDRPIWLMSYDGWTACTNSKFVEIARKRLGDAFDNMPGIERDTGTGEPTGVFYKVEDLEPIADGIFTEGTDVVFEGLGLVIDTMARWGITGIHDVGGQSMADLQVYDRLLRDGGLKTRVYVAMQHVRKGTDEQLKEFDQIRSTYSNEWIKAGAVKLFIDGVEDSHTAAMLEPYADRPDVVGETIYPPEEFTRVIETLDRMGFHCITHSCGDRGVRVVLDAYENARTRNGPRDSRHRIEHVEVVSAQDVPRFSSLGVIPSMQPLHAHLSAAPFDEAYGKTLGPQRLQSSFPWRSIVDSGARLTFSSDWPVADMNPFKGIHTALTRGGLVGPENTISLEDAIKGYTINAAYASFDETIKGSIEVGKLADMVVLSGNLFEMPSNDIENVEPLLTIVGGREVYRSEKFHG
ncbi:MAG: amidohydrolase [Candidatus Thermoplasmatota archaeon]|nr:amidohydrolase [Candidatus Thermoplasmatota archaeon]